jgi:hypothetical protein
MDFESFEDRSSKNAADTSRLLYEDLGNMLSSRKSCEHDYPSQQIESSARELIDAIKNPAVDTEQMRELIRKDFTAVKSGGIEALRDLAHKVTEETGVKFRVDAAVLPDVYSVITEAKNQLMWVVIE